MPAVGSSRRVPSYRLHKPTGQAVVTPGGGPGEPGAGEAGTEPDVLPRWSPNRLRHSAVVAG